MLLSVFLPKGVGISIPLHPLTNIFRECYWTACKLPAIQRSPVCQLHCWYRRVSNAATHVVQRTEVEWAQLWHHHHDRDTISSLPLYIGMVFARARSSDLDIGGMEEVEAWAPTFSWQRGRDAALRQSCLSLKFLACRLAWGLPLLQSLRRCPHCKLKIAHLKSIHEVLAMLSHVCLCIHFHH